MVNIQKIKNTFPGEGSSGDEAALASSMAPATPTIAASIVAARRKFRASSEAKPCLAEADGVAEPRQCSNRVLTVAARPREARTIHATVRASVSTANAMVAR